ncbi:hypothetical protein KVV02_002050 [Mortierella alpina]|uniref:SAP domain-containing protein n=1 Tax=Mortierella alpina TaxID=64518 RepID=A0A9P8AA02_MORAP|nr:hypothetical protein KVV02_002050 [Mortierella alpina]
MPSPSPSPIPRPSTPLLKRRKAELIELSLSLGLSGEGTREIVQERIRNYISNYGTSDNSLRDLVGKDDQESSNELQTTRDEDERLQHHVNEHPIASSFPRRSSGASRAILGTKGPDATSAMQDELFEAMDLARGLQKTLRGGQTSSRRSSASFQSASMRTRDHDSICETRVSGAAAVHGKKRSSSIAGSCSSQEGATDDDDPVECGYLKLVLDEWKRRVFQLGIVLGLTTSDCNIWTKLHDVGSTTTGLVWLTLLLELGVFLWRAVRQHDSWPQNVSIWTQLRTVTTDWAGFLKPFFVFYGTLFLIPTVLSQIVSMDRPQFRHGYRGILSTTTSSLSYFVLRFAIAYLLAQSDGSPWNRIEELKETFRYVPCTLILVTSGVGTILSLASIA